MKFKELLNEKDLDDYMFSKRVKPKGDCLEIFGKLLFGEFKKINKKIKEKDTNYESYVMKELINWIETSNRGIEHQADFTLALKQLLKCKNNYAKILKPQKNILYRGISDSYDIQKITQKDFSKKELKKYKKKDNRYIFNFKYKPYNIIESWSMSYKQAKKHGNNIIEAKIPENEILFSNDFLNLLSKELLVTKEDEVIRVSKKSLTSNIYIPSGDIYVVD